jgi:hypothetical protein
MSVGSKNQPRRRRAPLLHEWETVSDTLNVHGEIEQAIRRLRVPGGWLYQVSDRPIFTGEFIQSIVDMAWHPPVFVPETKEGT